MMFGLTAKLFGGADRKSAGDATMPPGALQGGTVGLVAGLVPGTIIATGRGWRPVEALQAGDPVLTFDNGIQPLRGVTRGHLWDGDGECPKGIWPLRIPPMALGNKLAMTLPPESAVMLESDVADHLFGDPFALVSGADLEAFRGIWRVQPQDGHEVIQLHFETPQMIYAGLGALTYCAPRPVRGVAALIDARPEGERYCQMAAADAAHLITALMEQDIEDEADLAEARALQSRKISA